jgi:hypothetical protein
MTDKQSRFTDRKQINKDTNLKNFKTYVRMMKPYWHMFKLETWNREKEKMCKVTKERQPEEKNVNITNLSNKRNTKLQCKYNL